MAGRKQVYILFLGKTGVGKTLTINMLTQILSYHSLDQALEAREPIVLVPVRYTESYPDGTTEEIVYNGTQIFDASNERGRSDRSCTQAPRMYSFKCADKTFNFIDMPGFGDTDGDGEDEQHKKKRYAFLEQIPQIHAIVAVVRADENRLSPVLVAALDDMLTMVPKTATANLMFFNTFASLTKFEQSSFVQRNLTEYLNSINAKYGVHLSYQDNVYFIDNYGLKYLLSYCKSDKYRLQQDKDCKPRAAECWQKTTEAFYAMTRKVLTLPGIPSTDIATINFARTLIEIVVRLLIEASDTVLKFDDPEVHQRNIQSMRQNPAMRGKTDKQISDYISKVQREFKIGLQRDYAAAAKALLKPAGFLKHHCIAPLSNGFRIRLKNQMQLFENQGDYDAMEEVEAELKRKDQHFRCIELILESADKISSLRETLEAPQELLRLKTIGKDVEKAFKENREAVKFVFEDTVNFKARYPIQFQFQP